MSPQNTIEELTQKICALRQESLATKERLALLTEQVFEYRSILDNANDMIHRVNSEGRFLFANRAWHETIGYTEEELRALTVLDLVDAPHREFCTLRFQALLRGEHPGPFETVLVAKDGKKILIEGQCRSEISDNKTTSLTAIFRDITERRKNEEQLHLTQFSVNHAEECIYWVTHEAKIVFANEAAAKRLGYGRAQLMQMTVFDIDPFFPKEYWPGHWQELRKVRSARIESFHRGADGSVFPVEIKTNYIKYNGQEYSFAFVTDITERKRSESSIQHYKQMLNTILESTADGILAVDNNDTILYANERFIEQWRIPRAYIAEKDDKKTLAYALEQLQDPQAFLARIKSLYASDEEATDTLYFKDGRIFTRYSRPFVQDGKNVGRVWSFRDITQRKLAEQALVEAHDNLEREVTARTIELSQANVALNVLLEKYMQDRENFEKQLLANLNEKMLPIVMRLKQSGLRDSQKKYLDLITASVSDIISPPAQNSDLQLTNLTATEKTVINLIRQSKSTKEIAHLLDISPSTVNTHRENIRKKIGIKNKRQPLKKALLSLL